MRISVENEYGLVRDTDSGAIINIDNSGYDKYIRIREKQLNDKQQVDQLVDNMQIVQLELNELKTLLTNILSRYGDHNS